MRMRSSATPGGESQRAQGCSVRSSSTSATAMITAALGGRSGLRGDHASSRGPVRGFADARRAGVSAPSGVSGGSVVGRLVGLLLGGWARETAMRDCSRLHGSVDQAGFRIAGVSLGGAQLGVMAGLRRRRHGNHGRRVIALLKVQFGYWRCCVTGSCKMRRISQSSPVTVEQFSRQTPVFVRRPITSESRSISLFSLSCGANSQR